MRDEISETMLQDRICPDCDNPSIISKARNQGWYCLSCGCTILKLDTPPTASEEE